MATVSRAAISFSFVFFTSWSAMYGAACAQSFYVAQQPVHQQGGHAAPAHAGHAHGGVAIIAAGTHFQAALKNLIDSATSQVGEEIQATLSAPLFANGVPVVPAGSLLLGQVTNVVSARRFQAGANGRVDIRFTAIETPDGRRFPLSASVDTSELRLTGGSAAGRIGKGMANLVAGAVRKGSEVKIPAGTELPILLDESLQVAGVLPPTQHPHGSPAPPPPQQPAAGFTAQ